MVEKASSRLRFALDANFPQPLLEAISPYFHEVELAPIQKIDKRLGELLDWQLIVAVSHLGFQALVSNDYHMLYEPKVLPALRETKMSIIAIEGLGHDAVRATGALLLDLPAIAKRFVSGTPQVFYSKRKAIEPEGLEPFLKDRASRQKISVDELLRRERLTAEELKSPLG